MSAQEAARDVKEERDKQEEQDALEEERHHRRRRRLIRWLAAFVILDVIVGAALGVQILRDRQAAEIARQEAEQDVGATQEMTQEERQALLDQAIGEAHNLVQMTSEVSVSGTDAQMIISNREESACSVCVVLLLVKDGQTEEIARTDLISPGWHVRSVTLARELEAGEHRALARCLYYTAEGSAYLGASARQILLKVQ